MSDLIAGILLSASFLWLILATTWRLTRWAMTPSPLPLVLAPAPRTRAGVFKRLFLEFFGFRSLARASAITWVSSIAFHYGLLIVLVIHLRFVISPLPLWLVPLIGVSGWATTALLLGLGALLLRRILVDRLRYISAPSDYLHLVLLLSIGLSGVALKRFWPADLYATGEFLRGALTFQWQPLPDHPGLWLHLLLVGILIVVFPISKLLHAPGILFSPTFNQRDPHA